MRLDQLSPSAAGPKPIAMSRSRRLVYALMAAVSLNAAACGPGGNTDNPDTGGSAGSAGMGGSAGEAGTGGTDTGGTGGTNVDAGGTGGTDAGSKCDTKEFEGLGSKVFNAGETGTMTVDLPQSDSDSKYNGMSFEVKDPAMFTVKTRVGIQKVVYVINQPGYENMLAMRPVMIDADRPYIENENGGCDLNMVEVNNSTFQDPLKRPEMKTPVNYYTSVFRVENNSEALADYEIQSDRTGITLDSVTDKNGETDYILGNSKPVVPDTVSAHRDDAGHIVLSLTGTTDEGYGNETVLSRLSATAGGVTFAPVPGQPGTFRSTTPSALTALNLTIAGLNDGLTDDKTIKSLIVTETDLCAGIDTSGHGTCTAGTVTCDPGYANNDSNPLEDCDGCDTGYTGYPTCEIIPPAPVISGLGIDCSVDGGYCITGITYPVSFSFQNAVSYTTSLQLISGSTTLGSIDQPSGTLTGSSKTFNYTLGNMSLATVRLTVTADGPGGQQSQFIDVVYY